MVSGGDLRRRVLLVAQGAGAGVRLWVGTAAGEVVFGKTQWGDGAARRQHWSLLKTGGNGRSGGRGGRRQADLSMGA